MSVRVMTVAAAAGCAFLVSCSANPELPTACTQGLDFDGRKYIQYEPAGDAVGRPLGRGTFYDCSESRSDPDGAGHWKVVVRADKGAAAAEWVVAPTDDGNLARWKVVTSDSGP